MKKYGLKVMVVAVLVLGLMAPMAHAEIKFEKSWWRDLPTYNEQFWGKFRFGFFNGTLGWLELFQEPYQSFNRNESVWIGIGEGLFNGIVDVVGGVLHVLTFPIPQWDIPLPEGGSDLGKV